MLEQLSSLIVDFVHQFGYFGIFVMTFLESTFMPIPSEITMIPAGYLVYQGHMHFVWVLLSSIAGTLAGSLFCYWLAIFMGRRLLLKYQRFLFLNEARLEKIDRYFAEHGSISIFSARLIPGIRHFISFPAGLSRMDLKKFIFFTALGGTIWMTILLCLGYFIGHNHDLIHRYISYITWAILAGLGLLVGYYIWKRRQKKGVLPPI